MSHDGRRRARLAFARCARRSCCLLLLLPAVGCDRGDRPAPAQDDSAGAMVTEQQFLERQVAADTVSGLAVAPDDYASIIEPNGAAPFATPAELRALGEALVMPVAGIAPRDLVGSFDEARGERRHEALDIRAPRGTPVVSATGGRLVKLHTSEFGGLMVYAADETERFILLYAHLDRYADGLVEGMPLRKGQRLGQVGTTGNAPPDVPHLHFGIARVASAAEWWKGIPVDPLPLLAR
jgi:murein DD-endopeptidase MepM/ murein hydrolase activator NlpD